MSPVLPESLVQAAQAPHIDVIVLQPQRGRMRGEHPARHGACNQLTLKPADAHPAQVEQAVAAALAHKQIAASLIRKRGYHAMQAFV
eukprot:CAMPEP_0115846730 /NCGR_PEP_ID=MMETSP0287-20121206/10010_1 /TAXON_ID=412157 /ORGANISM="Chrysochromulina rotalis, Strain UIO044" /LENGTH=86 /DNA_ID=CAMNT_0003300527 /DNA_START=932 /DNA_END=1193 /DNA_ORIENTATION=-